MEISEVSRGSIRFNMVAITANSRENSDFLVSERPPPPTPETRQPTMRRREMEKLVVDAAAVVGGRRGRGRERKGRWWWWLREGGWRGLKERIKALVVEAMEMEEFKLFLIFSLLLA